jgi:hypothetical protein
MGRRRICAAYLWIDSAEDIKPERGTQADRENGDEGKVIARPFGKARLKEYYALDLAVAA